MERLPSIYDINGFPTYDDVIKHIAERHGEEGQRILSSPNEAPVMWHECAHVGMADLPPGTVWDHDHVGTTQEIVEARMEESMNLIMDPDFISSLMEQMNDPNSPLSEAIKAFHMHEEEE